jgi:type IV pilus assembly protein PilF
MSKFENVRRFCFGTVLFITAWLAVGCVSNPTAGSAGKDLETASDETDVRRRARIRLELAVGYYQQDRVTVALDEIKQAIVIDPSLSDAYNLRGLIYMKLNEPKLAEDSFRRALSLTPNDGSLLHNYAWFHCTRKQFALAYPFFEQALASKNYTDASKTYMSLAMCLQADGKISEAERNFQRSYELDATNPVSGYNLALINYQRGEYTKTRFYIQRINASEYANAQTLWLGLKTERKLGNRDVYRNLADQLQRKHTGTPEARQYERGQFDD